MPIVETIKHLFHLLDRRNCKLTTNLRNVAYMLENFQRSQIKNIEIHNWRLVLSSHRFEVKYKPGLLNSAADALTRNFNIKVNLAQVSSVSMKENIICKLHVDLAYSERTRLCHKGKIRNLSYTLVDVSKVFKPCPCCYELKPNFHKSTPGKLTRPGQPSEKSPRRGERSQGFKGGLS